MSDEIITEGEVLPPERNPTTTVALLPLLFPPNWFEDAVKGWNEYISRPIYRPPDVQLRFPRSKKKRIQKKWRNNPKNWGQVIYTLSKNPKALRTTSTRTLSTTTEGIAQPQALS